PVAGSAVWPALPTNRASAADAARRLPVRPITHDDQPVGTGFRAPRFPCAPEHLAHVGVGPVAREAAKRLVCRLEADDRIGCEIGEPHLVAFIDVNRIGLRPGAWELPALPSFGGRVVHADVAGIPFADPQPAGAVGPYAPRALAGSRRLDHGRGAGL